MTRYIDVRIKRAIRRLQQEVAEQIQSDKAKCNKRFTNQERQNCVGR